jgi:hypothetical protein
LATDRLVKWSEEAQSFFQSAPDGSVVLDIVVSHACRSQSGEEFEELVNSLNSNEIKKKVKKVNITDTSYLYRLVVSGFSKYSDPKIPTEWFLANKDLIEKLQIEKSVKSWTEGLNSKEYKCWLERIMGDFSGDKKGNGINQRVRDAVMKEAAVAAYKGGANFENCVKFTLEECAYTCANFRNIIMVYPANLAEPILEVVKKYNVNIAHLRYKTSKQAQRSTNSLTLDPTILDKEVSLFMKEVVSNVNFFVIDKYGDHIYKNYALEKVIGEANAKTLNVKTWKNTLAVMKHKRNIVVEESDKGRFFLTVKSPLIIKDKVEGVIGLAIDITDRKKAQDLEMKNKICEGQRVLAEQVAHDITSPLIVLKKLAKNCENLAEKEHVALRNSVMTIESMAEDLLRKYV